MKRTPCPSGLLDELFVHERRGNSTHEDTLGLVSRSPNGEVDRFGGPFPLETKERRNVNPVPRV